MIYEEEGMKLWIRRSIGILAVGGSFTGLVIGGAMLVAPGALLAKVLALPFLALYCWGIWCGLGLLEGAEGALRTNRLFWAIQIPYLMSPVAGYFFASGVFMFATYQPAAARASLLWRFGSQFEYSLMQPDKPFVIGINRIAVAICIYLTLQLRGASGSPRIALMASEAPAPEVELDQLRKCLAELIAILDDERDSHWSSWMRTSDKMIAAGDLSGVDHFLGAFGGMGSFNDLASDRATVVAARAFELAREIQRRRGLD